MNLNMLRLTPLFGVTLYIKSSDVGLKRSTYTARQESVSPRCIFIRVIIFCLWM